MAATEKKQMWLVRTADGVAPETRIGKIAASQGVFMPGAPCYFSTDGTVKLCDTADGSDVWNGFIVGLTNKSTTWPIAAELAANTEVIVQIIDPDDYYAVFIENAGSDAAEAQTYVGEEYGLVVSSTAGQIGYTTLNVANANAVVRVVDIMSNVEPLKHSTSDSPGIAIVRFIASVTTGEKA